MSRTMSLTDDQLGVTMTLRVEDGKIKKLHFDAVNGAAVTAESLALVEAFGLHLPAPSPTAIEPPPADPPAAEGKGKAAEPAKQSGYVKAGTYVHLRPDDETLRRCWHELNGSTGAYAKEVGVPYSTMNNWLCAAKKRGVQFVRPARNRGDA